MEDLLTPFDAIRARCLESYKVKKVFSDRQYMEIMRIIREVEESKSQSS